MAARTTNASAESKPKVLGKLRAETMHTITSDSPATTDSLLRAGSVRSSERSIADTPPLASATPPSCWAGDVLADSDAVATP